MATASLLVVEDNREIRKSLRDLFTLEGFAVEEAGNGREALERLDAGSHPSMIVLDLVMPVMDGWEFLRQMRARPERDTPVVVLTSLAYDADTRGLRERYGVDVLDKSTEVVRLMEIARMHRAALDT
ncbi:response regulator [Lysobacter sp. N42]|uniref:response regulator n=1 Tax=Lysobacter sp. N42 TaxID=2545719 RepID=UPI001042AEB6|nr:response regulator [Lysobacter sp. N42]TCZ80261.1 response regulator [Lysobacter sp. N42]